MRNCVIAKKKKKNISKDMHITLATFQHQEILRNEQEEKTASD